MAGGPSQLDLFDYKPKLQEWDGKPTPDSYFKGKRFAFMDSFCQRCAETIRHPAEVQTSRVQRALGLGIAAAHGIGDRRPGDHLRNCH